MAAEQDPWVFIEKQATEMGVGAEALRKWRSRGVPYRYRLPLVEAARRLRVKLDTHSFDEPPNPVAAEPARQAG